jgi:hypothetical protein
LAWIEPNDVKEKSPGHNSWPRPDKPCGCQNDEHRCGLIEYQNRAYPSVVRPLVSNEVNLSRRATRSRSHYEVCTLLISDEAKATQGRHRTRAPESVYGNAAHLLKIEPIADTQTSPKCGRGGLI